LALGIDLFLRVLGHPLLQPLLDLITVLGSSELVAAILFLGPGGVAHQLHERLPLVVLGRGDDHVSILAGHEPSYHAFPGRGVGLIGEAAYLHPLHGKQRLEFGDVDVLAFAGGQADPEGGEGGDRGGEASVVVTHLAPGHHRRRIWLCLARDVDEGRKAGGVVEVEMIALVVPVGARLAVGGDGDEDEAGVDGAQAVVVQAQIGHLAGRAVLDEDVGLLGQALEDLAAAGCAQVKGDPQLVSVQVEEEAALLGMGDIVQERASLAGAVANLWLLHLDDLRAHISEELAAVGAADHLAVLEDLEPIEGCFRHAGASPRTIFSGPFGPPQS